MNVKLIKIIEFTGVNLGCNSLIHVIIGIVSFKSRSNSENMFVKLWESIFITTALQVPSAR